VLPPVAARGRHQPSAFAQDEQRLEKCSQRSWKCESARPQITTSNSPSENEGMRVGAAKVNLGRELARDGLRSGPQIEQPDSPPSNRERR
jgi:hypothetical protein